MSSFVVKLIIAIGLLAVTGITFESGLNGFERFYTLQVNEIEALKTRQADLSRQIETATASTDDNVSELKELESLRTGELQELAAREQDEIDAHTERCKAVGTQCSSGPYIAEIRKTYEGRRTEANVRYDGLKADLLSTRPKSTDVSPLWTERNAVETALGIAVTKSQVYRLAKRVFGHENAADVSEHEATLIAGIWYGGIALIAATTGVILAMAAAVLGMPPKGPGKTARTFRRLLLVMRRWPRIKVVETRVETIIEIVEKIVEKVTEVPVPHFIYVPVPEVATEAELAEVQKKALERAGWGASGFGETSGCGRAEQQQPGALAA